MRVLLVEDDRMLGEGLQIALQRAGYAVDWFQDGNTALQAVLQNEADVVVLDLGLPRRDGMSVIREARRAGRDVPILVLTARDRVEDRIEALDAGADDFLGKPFDPNELLARLRALLRRRLGRLDETLRSGALVLDPQRFEVSWHDQRVDLPRREFAVLRILVEHAGRVVSRDALQRGLYGWDDEVGSNAVEVHIHNLRKKLDNALIRTVRGVGYLLVVDPPA